MDAEMKNDQALAVSTKRHCHKEGRGEMTHSGKPYLVSAHKDDNPAHHEPGVCPVHRQPVPGMQKNGCLSLEEAGSSKGSKSMTRDFLCIEQPSPWLPNQSRANTFQIQDY
eukprot:scaffold234424_cov18-Tisochrysis_lutea.AAC.1